MSLLSRALADISYWVEQSDTWHARMLREAGQPQPGLERGIIELYSEEMGFPFSEEVYELYQWHDGTFTWGEWASLISSIPLDAAMEAVAHLELPKLILITEAELYFAVEPAEVGQLQSSIYCYDRQDCCANSLLPNMYAPSITSLMQAVAECANTYDSISVPFMFMDIPKLEYPTEWFCREIYQSLFAPIYARYGIKSDMRGGTWF